MTPCFGRVSQCALDRGKGSNTIARLQLLRLLLLFGFALLIRRFLLLVFLTSSMNDCDEPPQVAGFSPPPIHIQRNARSLRHRVLWLGAIRRGFFVGLG